MVMQDKREAAQAEVASTLWRERELLERLLFALSSQQLILAAGGVRWLTHADDHVRSAVDELSDCELRRAIVTNELALLLELAGDASLDDIVSAADEPWDALLVDHRDALRTLVAEISAATAENRRLLEAGASLAQETLARVGSVTTGYPGARPSERPGDSLLLDRQA